MDNDQLPEWVRVRKARVAAEGERNGMQYKEVRSADLLMETGAGELFAIFLDELHRNVKAAEEIGFRGSVTPKSDPNSDHRCHVEVVWASNSPRFTWVNIFYRGGSEIRFRTLEGSEFKLYLCRYHDEVRLREENAHRYMDAPEAAAWLIEVMCRRVEKMRA